MRFSLPMNPRSEKARGLSASEEAKGPPTFPWCQKVGGSFRALIKHNND